jgi:hypothetical protein
VVAESVLLLEQLAVNAWPAATVQLVLARIGPETGFLTRPHGDVLGVGRKGTFPQIGLVPVEHP